MEQHNHKITSRDRTQRGRTLHPHPRDHSLDFLRGAAVVLMIITHVNAFFYQNTGTWLDFFTWLGATMCFTVFLFVSGSISGMSIKRGTMTTLRAMKRGLHLLGIYYLVAFFMAFFNENLPATIRTVIDILSFRTIPEFTEFMIPFALFPMLVGVFLPVFSKNKRNPLLLISISLIAYALSSVLYRLDWGNGYLVTLKALLVGEGEHHVFPILSYLPIYTIGMWWGMRNREIKSAERKLTVNMLLVSVSSTLVLLGTGVSTWNRWPPSLLFFFYGFVFIFAIIWMHDFLHRAHRAHDIVAFFGHYAISYYVFHLVAILFLKLFITTGPFDELGTLAMIALTFLISSTFLIFSDLQKFIHTSFSRLLL